MASERPRRAFAGAKMSSLLDKVITRPAVHLLEKKSREKLIMYITHAMQKNDTSYHILS